MTREVHSSDKEISQIEQSFSNAGEKESKAPELYPTEDWMSLPWLLEKRRNENPHQVVIERKPSVGGTWRKVTAEEFLQEVRTQARGLVGMGLKPGDAIAIMSRTSYEWTLLDYAGWSAGLVVVPIYETSSANQISWILNDSKVRMVITESTQMTQLVQSALSEDSQVEQVLSLDDSALVTIADAGRNIAEAVIEERIANLNMDSLATVVYTSGTTGRPKGACLTHRCFVSLALNGHEWMPEVANQKTSRMLLFLPLAHVYARFLQVFLLSGKGVLAHTPDIKNLLADLAAFRPTFLLCVPRVLEKVYNSADANAGIGFKQRIFRFAAKTAIAYSQAQDTETGPSYILQLQHFVAERLVYRKIDQLLGGNVKHIISGGAPLGDRLNHFFRGIGISIYEGYGLTETTGPLSVNIPRLNRIGTVGPPIATLKVRITSDSEILVKGPAVFTGYLNQPEATKKVFTEDGWFRTGDLGSLDDDGFLKITGRAKEIIVTAGGKNVVPAQLEDLMRGHPLISQVVVVGDRRPFVGALVTIDAEMLPGWLKNHGLPVMEVAAAARNPQVLAALDRAMERVNQSVSRAESIRKITVLLTDFTVENQMLTPSFKIRRDKILDVFKSQIDDMYGGALPPQD